MKASREYDYFLPVSLALAAIFVHLLWRSVARTRPLEKQHITIERLMIHPLKSCMACDVSSVKFSKGGFDLDRKWMVYDVEKKQQVSARDNRGIKLVKVKPIVLRDDSSPTGGVLRITVPEDNNFEQFDINLYPTDDMIQSWPAIKEITLFSWNLSGYVVPSSSPTKSGRTPSEIMSEFLGREVKLVVKSNASEKSIMAFPNVPEGSDEVKSFADVAQGMMISGKSLRECEKIAGGPLAIERFRPNLFVEGIQEPFQEDDILEVTIGKDEARFTVPNRTPRCMFPSVDPKTGRRDGIFPHRQLLKARRVDKMMPNRYCLGVYLVPYGEGVIHVGDRLKVTKSWKNPKLGSGLESNVDAEKKLIALADE